MENPYEISAADHRIISEPVAGKKGLIFIRLAVIFSSILVALQIFGLILVLLNKADLQTIFRVIETAICIGLTIGLIFKSRICAIALFISTAGMQIYRAFEINSFSNFYFTIALLIVFVLIAPIFLGIPGTFAYHKQRKSLAGAKTDE